MNIDWLKMSESICRQVISRGNNFSRVKVNHYFLQSKYGSTILAFWLNYNSKFFNIGVYLNTMAISAVVVFPNIYRGHYLGWFYNIDPN